MTPSDFIYKALGPPASLSDYVDSYWMLSNPGGSSKEVIVLPDGRVDVFFTYSSTEPYQASLAGLGSEPSLGTLAPKALMFAISFKLPAVEYLLGISVASHINTVKSLDENFWGISVNDLDDFDKFCEKISLTMETILAQKEIDLRKKKLFDLIYSSQGNISVQDLADQAGWSSRQINRYFNQWFGISLKTYCNILRYRASFTQIKEGKLFAEGNFSDQAHFIKDVKKFSGVTPKELSKNKNDRFIQFSTLPKK